MNPCPSTQCIHTHTSTPTHQTHSPCSRRTVQTTIPCGHRTPPPSSAGSRAAPTAPSSLFLVVCKTVLTNRPRSCRLLLKLKGRPELKKPLISSFWKMKGPNQGQFFFLKRERCFVNFSNRKVHLTYRSHPVPQF